MTRHLSLPVLAVLLGFGSQAAASWSPGSYRCAYDYLNQDQARGRQNWAKRCAALNPYGRPTTRDQAFWLSSFTADAMEAYATYGIYVYPVYSSWDGQPFLGPGAPGSSTAGLSGDQIEALSCEYKPMDVFMDGLCEPG